MVAIRDLKCSMDIAEMAALGWFAEEFIVYGCCYIENGKLYYKVSSQSAELYRFREKQLKRGIYVSPVDEMLNRVMVPSGMQDEYALRTKIKLAKRMKCEYDETLMQKFVLLAEQEQNNNAAELLCELKQKMTGCFEQEIVQLVESIVDYAHQQKKLCRETYNELCQWLEYVYSQMEDDVVIRRDFQRTFYGFGYQTSTGNWKYYTNASEGEARKRKEELLCKGTRNTPILKKTYYFDNQPNLLQVKEQFVQQLKTWMDEEYIEYLQRIDLLPATVPVKEYQELEQKAKEENRQSIQRLLQYYRNLWNLQVKE